MDVVIYARYSSDRQTEQSIEGQLRSCQQFADREGHTVVGTYIDRAITGRTDHRPEFQRMIRDSGKGLWDAVIVYKLDRFSRNRYDTAIYKNKLKKNGVRVISATEAIMDGPEGIILESMLEGMAEYYSAELAQKTLRGMRESAYKCHVTGQVVFGYKSGPDKEYLINEAEAPAVKYIFEQYASGESMTDIAADLNEKGYRTRNGNLFTGKVLNHILKNEKYIGVYRYQDIVSLNGIPPLVDRETWEAVQKKMKANKRSPARSKAKVDYILTGKLFCGRCGKAMIGESGTGKNGTIYYYYKCAGRKLRSGCKKQPVPKAEIEKAVIDYTVGYVLRDDNIQLIAKRTAELAKQERENDEEANAIRQHLSDNETAIKNVMKAIESGIITKTTKARLEELEAEQVQLKDALALAEIKMPEIPEEYIASYLQDLRQKASNADQARSLVEIFISKIYLYDDKLVITYNSPNHEEKALSFEEISGIVSDFTAQGVPNVDYPKLFVLQNGFGIIVKRPGR